MCSLCVYVVCGHSSVIAAINTIVVCVRVCVCSGGRPAAVSADNVASFVRLPDGSLRFKYIVEGANL